ncbi:beta-propeller fold lactonase family protein [Novipirellula herctigrandis]
MNRNLFALAFLNAFVVFGLTARAADSVALPSSIVRSPICIAVSTDSEVAYIADRTARCLSVVDLQTNVLVGEIPLRGMPQGLVLSSDGGLLYVTERSPGVGAGTIAVIDTKSREVTSRIPVGHWPTDVALSYNDTRLYVANQDSHTVSVIDLSKGTDAAICSVPVVREPYSLAVSPDNRTVVVANLLPFGAGTDVGFSASVSLLRCTDADAIPTATHLKLPTGSSSVKGVCVSPDNQWAYVVHNLGRFNLPVTQLERGWVNTTALTVIDLPRGRLAATVLLDELMQGAPDPDSIVCTNDGHTLWISHSGVHKISRLDVGQLHQMLAGNLSPELESIKDGSQANIWVKIKNGNAQVADLANDLTALYISKILTKFPSGGIGPRGIALTKDDSKVIVANYFSGSVAVIDTNTGELLSTIMLGDAVEPDLVRQGEIAFHDARLAFQQWLSCASCHPNDGRTDALRWDFMRDGIGNAKDTPSLILVRETPPLNRRATRKTVRECARTGVMVSHRIMPTSAEVDGLTAYLNSLEPESNPNLTEQGKLTDAAERGKAIFEGKGSCLYCHPAPYYTDKQMHNVGTPSPHEPDGQYDTPSLIELHRTAPYLHDGRAAEIRDVFTVHDEQGDHGSTKELSESELDDLIEYLRSL